MSFEQAQLIGGKRKNGHKLTCACHICENMKNKAKRGGYGEEQELKMEGGSKKKNGHRKDCACPICKNMNNSKKRGRRGGARKSKKLRGGKEEGEDFEEEGEDFEEEGEEKEEKDFEEKKGEEVEVDDEVKVPEELEGGRKKKKGNGHKSNCKCPICKNMRKSKKGGDPENGSEVVANLSEYDDLNRIPSDNSNPDAKQAAGTRRKRRGRKSRKTRKNRRYRR
jgi:hypothetical protein